MSMSSKWPKTFPPLTAEQKRINDDFVKHWHEVLPKRFGMIEKFNHGYPVKNSGTDFVSTLEIGAGLGEHLEYEHLTPQQRANYVAVDIRQNMVDEMQRRYPDVKAICADCQEHIDYPDGSMDRLIAIHVLEHLPNLPRAIEELHRLCNKSTGRFHAVIPCEGSLAYTLARRISAQRIFEKRYGQSYDWFITREHINLPHEIFEEIERRFIVETKTFFPIAVPSVELNLVIGLTARPR
jgi:SAM-dependent methyltransferase